nr:alanine racemase [Lachnoclostridium edouardi]
MEYMDIEKRIQLYDRGYAAIDLDAIESNMKAMRDHLSPGAGIMGVVKADGYGHGAVWAARVMDSYVQGYAVSTVDEALILRRHGIKKNILVLGVVGESRYNEVLDNEIRIAMFQYDKAKLFSHYGAARKKTGYIHLAVDTGMSRIGMRPDLESAETAKKIWELPFVETEGIFTHFSRADETDKNCSQQQLLKFTSFVNMLENLGVHIPIKHCSNSAGIIDLKQAHMDLVRAGISIYGLYPSDQVDREAVPLKPVMSWKSYVVYVKTIEPGTPVSYGGAFVAKAPTRVATIPIGYADGYSRSLSGKGQVLICGQRAPVLGRVCMDQMMVDVTHIPEAREGSTVTLLGRDGEEEITAEEMAESGGGFHYEILCSVGKRMPRVYYKKGKAIDCKDYFSE